MYQLDMMVDDAEPKLMIEVLKSDHIKLVQDGGHQLIYNKHTKHFVRLYDPRSGDPKHYAI